MDKVKINKAIDALGLSLDNKNTLKEALNQEYKADITEIETKVDNIDKGLGTAKADISNLGVKVNNFINANEIIKLGVGVDEETKAANIAKLSNTQHTFFTSINHAYGTASWLPADGGNAFIITDEGHAVKYTISKDGEVTKGKEFTLKDFTSELNNKVDKEDFSTELNNKVDKVKGKQLSSNDYTTAEKNKLANLQNYTLPAATKTTLGGVKAITNIVNVDAEAATIPSLAGVINTLLTQLRTAGIIQM